MAPVQTRARSGTSKRQSGVSMTLMISHRRTTIGSAANRSATRQVAGVHHRAFRFAVVWIAEHYCVVMTPSRPPGNVADRFKSAWARTDALFRLVAQDAMLARPISLRHPFIFYLGHLPAFAWNHLCRGVLGRSSFHSHFDEIFDRGIDPDVDDPALCHPHPTVPDRWPNVGEVIAYRDQIREAVLDALPEVEACASRDVMAQHGRVCEMTLEHEVMHQETLLYMVQQLPAEARIRPSAWPSPVRGGGPRVDAIDVEGGPATLGAPFESLGFGWDNEFPEIRVDVPGFVIDALPVTNTQFFYFVENGGYDCPDFWSEEDWIWKTGMRLKHPLSWTVRDGDVVCRTLFDEVPLLEARDWPMSVSLAEARAYARWSGARLPTEAEFHRAAYGQPDGGERSYPWGEDPPSAEHGNFDFTSWAPTPTGSHPRGVSAWGVHELVGNGWEWTETVFGPFPGFRAYIPAYPGYSADFFDGKHYVLKGASWATDKALLRRSFRNWYQARYPYVFTKFRCIRPID